MCLSFICLHLFCKIFHVWRVLWFSMAHCLSSSKQSRLQWIERNLVWPSLLQNLQNTQEGRNNDSYCWVSNPYPHGTGVRSHFALIFTFYQTPSLSCFAFHHINMTFSFWKNKQTNASKTFCLRIFLWILSFWIPVLVSKVNTSIHIHASTVDTTVSSNFQGCIHIAVHGCRYNHWWPIQNYADFLSHLQGPAVHMYSQPCVNVWKGLMLQSLANSRMREEGWRMSAVSGQLFVSVCISRIFTKRSEEIKGTKSLKNIASENKIYKPKSYIYFSKCINWCCSIIHSPLIFNLVTKIRVEPKARNLIHLSGSFFCFLFWYNSGNLWPVTKLY